ncbi:MAG: RdgB/HAM1 family non-canonical purine NTP pyrophosphatase [Chloroflexi bacterium]|nr:RdgB/HAM1 family non-canonical purine NTP pyrophosphatase [Chloroflexota bacterium]MCY3937024.1 RdgB/HAM1 family non-canonical purine NTP pyrophosphatase [Chloroflexota bacterium]
MTEDGHPIRVLLASANSHKLREYTQILAGTGVSIVSPADAGIALEVAEDGTTFLENARAKAIAFSKAADFPVMGDDSGLVVDSLGGRPGVYSRRFGSMPDDEGRMACLLQEMNKAESKSTSARFICAIAVAHHGKVVFETERSLEGTIASAPRGKGGFGYDPVFIPDGYSATLGELSAEIKNRISHRALAAADAASFLTESIV